jgi:hypothetical protein
MSIFRQVANNVTSLGCISININGKNRPARLIHAHRRAENFWLLHPGIGDSSEQLLPPELPDDCYRADPVVTPEPSERS